MITFPKTGLRGQRIYWVFYFEAFLIQKLNISIYFSLGMNYFIISYGMLHPFLEIEVSIIDFRNSGKSETEVNAWSHFLSGKLSKEFRAGEMNSVFKGFTNLG